MHNYTCKAYCRCIPSGPLHCVGTGPNGHIHANTHTKTLGFQLPALWSTLRSELWLGSGSGCESVSLVQCPPQSCGVAGTSLRVGRGKGWWWQRLSLRGLKRQIQSKGTSWALQPWSHPGMCLGLERFLEPGGLGHPPCGHPHCDPCHEQGHVQRFIMKPRESQEKGVAVALYRGQLIH